jgi:FkbM family methyltransferase
MDHHLYGQDPELQLLAAFVPRLPESTVIDVGAERGSFADGLLKAGTREVYALEAHPDNAAALVERFANDPRVHVRGGAISDRDGEAVLHVSAYPGGREMTFAHTLLERPNTDEIQWRSSVRVQTRSLGSLLAAGELPERVGILKIDTEGHDLEVVRGLGGLECDVVMVEHWLHLPQSLGPCPWTAEDMHEQLRPRGFSHVAFIMHVGEFVRLRWDRGDIEPGSMGNLIFINDRVLGQVASDLLDCASRLTDRVLNVARMYMEAAGERLEALEAVNREADKRLVVIEELREELRQVNERGLAG